MEVRFPFGHGLSYTTFGFHNMKLDKKEVREEEEVTVTVEITNTGKREGKEVVQLYVRDNTKAAIRPDKELKGFEAVHLTPGETKIVSFVLSKRSFAWYNENISDWYAATGDYSILIGNSSRNIVLDETIHFISQTKLPFAVDKDTMLGELMTNPKTLDYLKNNLLSHMGAINKMENSEMAGMMEAMIKYMPLRSLRSFGTVTNEAIDKLVMDLNDILIE